MVTFDVCLNLKVVCGDGETWIHRWIKLPFVPTPGQQLWLGEEQIDWDRTLYVEESCWLHSAETCHVMLADFDAATVATDSIAVWVARFVQAGWEVAAA